MRSASWALSMAEVTSASRITAWASQGWARRELASISRASTDWSREPQLTPMRTGLPYLQATSIICR